MNSGFADLDLYPVSSEINSDGELLIAGNDLNKLVKDFGTPLYLYDGQTIRNQIHNLSNLLQHFYPGKSISAYAAKAYFCRRLGLKLVNEPLDLDVVSSGELTLAKRCGFDPERIHFHGNNKTLSELKQAIEWNVHAIVVDSMDEIYLIEKIASEMNKHVQIWLRLTPDIHVATHPHIETSAADSKFGLHIQSGEAQEAIKYAMNSQWLKLIGLHCHLGSQLFDAEPYRLAIEMVYRVSNECGYEPQEISPGGGWGVRYTSEDPENNPEYWIKTISDEIQIQCQKYNQKLPKLILEPGRFIIARSGVSIYKIGTIKKNTNGLTILAVDGGMADNPRFALYQAKYSAKIINKASKPGIINSRIVGKYCESGDILIDQIMLPAADRDDLLIIPVSGAYQLSMSSNYNLSQRPAVLWLEANGTYELLQQRETIEDMLWWL